MSKSTINPFANSPSSQKYCPKLNQHDPKVSDILEAAPIMEPDSKCENAVISMQQPLHFQHERDRWRKLLLENGRDFSLFGTNFKINNKTYKNVDAAKCDLSGEEILLQGTVKLSLFRSKV